MEKLKANMFPLFHTNPLDSRPVASRVKGECHLQQLACVASTERRYDVAKA